MRAFVTIIILSSVVVGGLAVSWFLERANFRNRCKHGDVSVCSTIIASDDSLTTENLAVVYNDRGVGYEGAGNTDKALFDFNMAISLKPDFAQAYNNRGKVFADKNEDGNALNDYNTAIRIKPSFDIAHNNRGVIYYRACRYALAIEEYNSAIRYNPNYAEAYYDRGLARHKISDMRGGDSDIGMARKLGFNADYGSAIHQWHGEWIVDATHCH